MGLAWLDYSDSERQKVLDVVDLFRERDTRDELGLGVIRDGLADLLFPGTSTVQTRARYFLFIPWMYQEIEAKYAGRGDAAVRARRYEVKLIDSLAASDDARGTIGIEARGSLQRLPSGIYWQGLGRIGIRQMPWSLAQYHRWIDLGGPQREASLRNDDEEIEGASGFASWHGAPGSPDGFPEDVSLRLKTQEAEYLTERLLQSAPNALITYLARSLGAWERVPFAWLHPHVAELPPDLQERIAYARAFSEVMHGAPLLYNLMLAELVDSQEWIETYREALETWAAEVTGRANELASNGPAGLWEIVRPVIGDVSPPTRRFVEGWWRFLEAPHQVVQSEPARALVEAREVAMKGGQARLRNAGARRLWSGAAGTDQLGFRWAVTQEHLLDIVGARSAGDA